MSISLINLFTYGEIQNIIAYNPDNARLNSDTINPSLFSISVSRDMPNRLYKISLENK